MPQFLRRQILVKEFNEGEKTIVLYKVQCKLYTWAIVDEMITNEIPLSKYMIWVVYLEVNLFSANVQLYSCFLFSQSLNEKNDKWKFAIGLSNHLWKKKKLRSSTSAKMWFTYVSQFLTLLDAKHHFKCISKVGLLRLNHRLLDSLFTSTSAIDMWMCFF